MVKNSFEYPWLWEDFYTSRREAYCCCVPMSGIRCSPCESLFSIIWAYQAWLKAQDELCEAQDKAAYIAKQRAKIGRRITKRYAPSGYTSVTKPLARKLYENGCDVTLAGNNVNSFHIFGGWGLGCTINMRDDRNTEHNNVPVDFEDICQGFLDYLEPELGRYVVFYVRLTDLG